MGNCTAYGKLTYEDHARKILYAAEFYSKNHGTDNLKFKTVKGCL